MTDAERDIRDRYRAWLGRADADLLAAFVRRIVERHLADNIGSAIMHHAVSLPGDLGGGGLSRRLLDGRLLGYGVRYAILHGFLSDPSGVVDMHGVTEPLAGLAAEETP